MPRTHMYEENALNVERTAMFVQLLRENHSEIFSFIFAMVQHQADAEDLYQDTVTILWKKFDEFEPGTSFRSWAVRIAHINVLNFARSKRRRKLLFSEDLMNSIAATHKETIPEVVQARRDALRKCLQHLREKDRGLVFACYSGDRSMVQIAQQEGRTEAAVYKAISRIRQLLYSCIERRLAAEVR